MTDQHPITPPPELVASLRNSAPHGIRDAGVTRELWLINHAYAAGADQELEACCEWLDYNYPSVNVGCLRAATLLQQQAAPSPAVAPVPVSERLPGPEDCDVAGRCWLGGHQMGSGTPTWLLGYPAWAERFPDVHRFWLPANALPLPAPEPEDSQP